MRVTIAVFSYVTGYLKKYIETSKQIIKIRGEIGVSKM